MSASASKPLPLRIALLLLVVLSLMWGYNWVVMKSVLRFAAPMDFAALRTLIGAISMFVLLWLHKKPLTPPPYWQAAVGLGALQTAGFLAFSQFALLVNGAGKTSVLIYTMPFWTILLARPLLQERIQGVQWLAVLLALAGLGLIVDPWHRTHQPLGDFLAVGAGLCWAGGTIIAKRLQQQRNDVDLLRLNAWQMALGALPLLLLAPFVPGRPLTFEPYFIVALLYTGILGTALGWLMWLYILHSLSAGIAGLSMLAIPVIAVLSASFELGEALLPQELAGMLAIAAGLVVISLRNLWRTSR